ncbi:MAG: hypothetical protein EAZ13_10045 [Sphingobacteriia bacterium]|nr:MAG: hypothetical protein EAZ41_00975 [Sphingobacteriia bacterium]TAG30036.1 MAG: hypothetical protein EAZ35_08660 [Sphingobacteriia bacterium]TAH06255.1 MAG: hypothetical protein EAZ13_10045 [Sphingobacteriia bacterium]
MFYLLGSIILTSYLLLSFKVIQKFNVPVFPAIVFNYFTCVITGSIVNGAFPIRASALGTPWFKWSCIMGVLFIILFNLIGVTAQKIGVAVASVANKLSLIIPVVLSVYLYNESVVGWELVGIVFALASVMLTCMPSRTAAASAGRVSLTMKLGLPFLLFLGSGLLDALINHVQQKYVTAATNNSFLISGFFAAGLIGGIVLCILYLQKKWVFEMRQLIAGICIGVPNYFSIWCLVNYLQASPLETSASIPVNNLGIVLFSTLGAVIFFKEKLTKINVLGVLLSVVAIYLIAFGNTL